MLTNISKGDINRIGRIVAEKHPELVAAYRHQAPSLTDMNLICEIYDYFCKELCLEDEMGGKILFTAAILELYSPGCLEYSSLNLKAGMRAMLAFTYKYENGSNINSILNMARAYYKGRGYKGMVNAVIEAIKIKYTHA